MANPKYIDESLIYNVTEEEENKGSKKPYSFRCDEKLLDDLKTYAKLEGTTMPNVVSNIISDFLENKTLNNTYLPEYEGQYISIPSNVNEETYDYELRAIVNNLDEWDTTYGYVSKQYRLLHEGIDFVVIPETLHGEKLPAMDQTKILDHALNLNNLPDCLYCIYMTVDRNHELNYEVISWIDAMNKLKESGKYDLISHANKIKKELNRMHEDYITERQLYDDEIMMWNGAYSKLLKIADTYNTGAILPASNSIDNIEYAPIIDKLPDNYNLLKENKKLKDMEDELITIKNMIKELNDKEYTQDEILKYHESKHDLPESDDEKHND